MGFTTAALVLGGLGGFGIAEAVQGMSKSPSAPAQAALPDSGTATDKANSKTSNTRQLLLASGGQTDYTGGLGVLTGSDVSKSTLVGG